MADVFFFSIRTVVDGAAPARAKPIELTEGLAPRRARSFSLPCSQPADGSALFADARRAGAIAA